MKLIDHIWDSFNDKNSFLGIFVDISKVFDTVDYSILLKKLEHYIIKGRNLSWFQSCLSNRKQYIDYEQENENGNIVL